MIVNGDITVYHSTYDEEARCTKWHNKYYKNVWYYVRKGAVLDGNNSNDIQVRIWYNLNDNLNITDFAIGDKIVVGNNLADINDIPNEIQFTITSITDNQFGLNTHIHLSGV